LPSRSPPGTERIVDVDDERLLFAMRQRLFTVGENSVSVISTFASPCPSMNAIASASRRVLSVFSTPPAIGTPKCAFDHLRRVREHRRHGVADADPAMRER
jgi:hypothetical protein